MRKPFKLFSFRFSEIDYEFLRKRADKKDTVISKLIRTAIKNYIRRLK